MSLWVSFGCGLPDGLCRTVRYQGLVAHVVLSLRGCTEGKRWTDACWVGEYKSSCLVYIFSDPYIKKAIAIWGLSAGYIFFFVGAGFRSKGTSWENNAIVISDGKEYGRFWGADLWSLRLASGFVTQRNRTKCHLTRNFRCFLESLENLWTFLVTWWVPCC